MIVAIHKAAHEDVIKKREPTTSIAIVCIDMSQLRRYLAQHPHLGVEEDFIIK